MSAEEVDNWEQRTAEPVEDAAPAKPKPKFSLNAPAFVPFIPGAAATPAQVAPVAPAAPTPAAVAPPPVTPPPAARVAEASSPAPAATSAATTASDSPFPDDEAGDEDGDVSAAAVGPDGLKREHLNIVFIGHVDAGKSTISGHLMYLTGQVDDRTLEKFEREAKSKGRESWKYAWALDTTEQERAKGKTQEIGRASFFTDKRRFTILDAPGHKSFVPHMIGGASQADIGVLVISARRGEFETGFDRGGQTREHAMLARTTGIKQLVVVINKMDDATVMWDQARYDECVTKLVPFLKQCGFNPKSDLHFMPVSGYSGEGLKDRVLPSSCPWYDGPSLLEFLDNVKVPDRGFNAPVRLIINDKYKEMGTVVMGKLEAGTIKQGQKLMVMPNRVLVDVEDVMVDGVQVAQSAPGDNPRLRIRGIEEEDIRSGFVLCDPAKPCSVAKHFDVKMQILEHKSIICPGYSCVLHLHGAIEECEIEKLLALLDKKTQEVTQKLPKFVRPGQSCIARIKVEQPTCVEAYKEFAQMGRFMIRDEGKTVAAGVVVKVHPLKSD